jgi:hypothetical protein
MINAIKVDLEKQVANRELGKLEPGYAKIEREINILEIKRSLMKKQILTNLAIIYPENESAKWVNPVTGGSLTRIPANRFKFDIQKFIALLPVKILDKVTKKVVDSRAYIAAIETGLVDNDKMVATGAVEQIRDIRLCHDGGKDN